ncbi:MAG: bacillithiol biosynthesis deacetylase BshB1 [Actinomycetota bacterium]|nr:bacillithiol biosynthesis deacetylase BshB1 [Actinomycetota bacterium]
MVDVVCIGAHPDDVEIGMGATIVKMVRSGLSVAIVDLTDGEPTPHGSRETRAIESARAAEILGAAQRRTLSGPNRYLMDTVAARTELAGVLRELRPDTMFVPFPEDAHPDHIAASSIARAARFYAKFTKTDMIGEPHYPSRVFQYMAVHMRLVREPSFIIEVAKELPVKLEALAAYESQFSANPGNANVVPMMEQMARMWGTMIRSEAGEPFFSDEPIGLRGFSDLV